MKNTLKFLESKNISPEGGVWIVKRDGEEININELLDEYQKEYDTVRQSVIAIRKFWGTRLGKIVMAALFIAFGLIVVLFGNGLTFVNWFAYGFIAKGVYSLLRVTGVISLP